MTPRRPDVTRPRRRGFTLLEVVVVMTIMGVMISIPTPMFLRAVEQSKLDVTAASLRAIWNAERLYRLENGRYGTIAELASGGSGSLIDPSLVSGSTFYGFSVDVASDGSSFVATAQHPGNSRCYGAITLDETGTLSCGVVYDGAIMTPSLEPEP